MAELDPGLANNLDNPESHPPIEKNNPEDSFTKLAESDNNDDDGHVRRTGNVWTASAHVVTAVIGSGVLSLAWSIAKLGWIAGPIILLAFAFVTYYTSMLLADSYRFPDPVTGKRNTTYRKAVQAHLGGRQVAACAIVQYVNLVGIAIGYNITASISMVAIKRSDCFHTEGHDAECHVSNNFYMALFGAFQIVLSTIPDFDRIWWLSIVAAVMSFSYSSIGLGLATGRVIRNGQAHGTAAGTLGIDDGKSLAMKTFSVFQALGNIAFAYAFSVILIEIQDTLKSPPAENKTMKKATLVGIAVTTAFYASVGCIGYAALGNAAPGNILTGFGFYNPYWLIDIANLCIIIHLVGAYQVFAQPIFACVEFWASKTWPKSVLINREYGLVLPLIGTLNLSIFKLVWRTAFVVFTTIMAMLLPFFNDIVGLLGALAFWPLTVYFPVSMHISQTRLKSWTPKWLALQALSGVCLLISLVAGIGSIASLVDNLKTYAPFSS